MEKITEKELLQLQKKLLEGGNKKEYKPYMESRGYGCNLGTLPSDSSLAKHIKCLDDRSALIFLTMANARLDAAKLSKDLTTQKARNEVNREIVTKAIDELGSRLGLYKNKVTSLMIKAERRLREAEDDIRKKTKDEFTNKVFNDLIKNHGDETVKILADNYEVSEEELINAFIYAYKPLTHRDKYGIDYENITINNYYSRIITKSDISDDDYQLVYRDDLRCFLRNIPKIIDEYREYEMNKENPEQKKKK